MARPTKYNEQILEKTRAYIKEYNTKHDDLIPSIAGLSIILGVRRETIHVWAKEEGKEEFSNILAELNATQEKLLVNGGLGGTMNSNITKLVLGKHGYSEKQDVDHTTQGEKISGIERVIMPDSKGKT